MIRNREPPAFLRPQLRFLLIYFRKKAKIAKQGGVIAPASERRYWKKL
jgi:hypothetical protein